MLVLSRRVGQQLRIADEVEITILDIVGKKVRLGISAPCDMPIFREEVYRRLEQEACLQQALRPDLTEDETICEMELVVAR